MLPHASKSLDRHHKCRVAMAQLRNNVCEKVL